MVEDTGMGKVGGLLQGRGIANGGAGEGAGRRDNQTAELQNLLKLTVQVQGANQATTKCFKISGYSKMLQKS